MEKEHIVHLSPLSRVVLAVSVPMLLAACVSKPPTEFSGETLITYETEPGPFCGRCRSIKLTVASDGRAWIEEGHWAGNYSNWTIRRRQVEISLEQFDSFRRKLEPYRPEGTLALNDKPPCQEFWNDMAGVRINWRDEKASQLLFNFGCSPTANATMRADLKSAPGTLAIKGLDIPNESFLATTPR